MRPRVSIVIPTYQRRASVDRLLRALRGQTSSADSFEVVVSIDGLDDGTGELASGVPAPYRLRVLSGRRQGRASACNAGIRAADGDLIVLLDDDMEPSPELITAHLDAHPPGTRRAVVGAAPMIAGPDASPLVRYRARGFNGRLARLATPGRPLGFREAYTGNFSIRRDVILSIGGFDEGFRMYGHEDYELALRLTKAGVELAYSPAALAWQHYEKDFAALAHDCVERGQTAVLFAEKQPDAAPYLEVAGYRRASRRRRVVRAALLALTAVVPCTPRCVVAAIKWLERRQASVLNRCYEYSIDYFYWLGVKRARAAREAIRPLAEQIR